MIADAKKKPDYNALTVAALEGRGYPADKVAEELIALTKATKGHTLRGSRDGTKREASKRVLEPDNTVRLNAVRDIGDVYGVKAPVKQDHKHTMAAMSDEEIFASVDKSIKELHANDQPQITSTPDAGSNAAVAAANAGPDVVEQAGEQAVRAEPNGEVEGAVLPVRAVPEPQEQAAGVAMGVPLGGGGI
jgi:hypothetical protein